MEGLERVLEKMYELLKPGWVVKFLLDSTASEDVAILTSEDKLSYAFGGTMNMSGDEPPPFLCGVQGNQNDAPCNSHTLEWVCVPVLSVGTISVSLMVARVNNVDKKLFYQMRCDETGDTLAVCSQANNVCMVHMVKAEWPLWRKRRRYFIVLPTDALRSSDVHAAARATTYLRVCEEDRLCSICAIECSCRRPKLTLARHPFDLATSARNMLAHVGMHVGVSSDIIFSNGVPFRATPKPTFGGLTGGYSGGTVTALLEWAVCSRFRCSLEKVVPSFPLTPVLQSSSCGSEAPLNLDPPSADGLLLDGAHKFLDDVLVGGWEVSGPCDAEKSKSMSSVEQAATVSSAMQLLPQAAKVHIVPKPPVILPRGVQQLQFPQVVPQIACVPVENYSTKIVKEVSSEGTTTTEHKYALKLHLRKLRNRESAARSNKRKQLYRKELKSLISEQRDRVTQLKSRLGSLQAENKSLRSAIDYNTPAN